MKITSIVENTSALNLPVEHGLSLYIQMDDGKKILFDMGQRRLFAENAERLGLSISAVDIAIISHGHYDHGGGLRNFLELNKKAKVFIHKDAFQPHYSLRDKGLAYIGIEPELQDQNRLVICDSFKKVTDKMEIFADVQGDCCKPIGNRLLFGPTKTDNDLFSHEQNLVIKESTTFVPSSQQVGGENIVLFAGCAHNGIVNIIRKAEAVVGKPPTHVLGGMHLVKSGLSETEENIFIASLAKELMLYKDTKFYTMHCTGESQFCKLKAIMGDQIKYLSCGESVEFY